MELQLGQKQGIKTIEIRSTGRATTPIRLEVLRETPTRIITRPVFSLGVLGGTMKQRLKGEVVWEKETRRIAPYDSNQYEFYRIVDAYTKTFQEAL